MALRPPPAGVTERENGADPDIPPDLASFPGSLLPPGNPGSELILDTYPVQWVPPCLGSRPSLSGSRQQAWSLGLGSMEQGREQDAAFSPIPGMAWDITSGHLLSKRLYCVIFHSWY